MHAAQTTKALGVQARTLELLEKMGLAEAMLAQGLQAHSFAVYSERKQLARIDFTHFVDSPYPYPYPYLLMIPQNATESILNEHLLRQGVTIERGVALMSFTQGAGEVEGVLRRCYGITTTGLILIRPDSYIGFRASSLEAPSLQDYLAQHFTTAKLVQYSDEPAR